MPDSTSNQGDRVGDRVRELRRRRGLTQEELAAQSGISKTVIAKIEQGGTARMETYHQLARTLGVRTVWFADPASPEPAEHAHDELVLADLRSAINPPVDITGRPYYGTADADTADLTRLRAAVDTAAAAYHGDRYDDLAEIMPALVRSAHHHVTYYDGGPEQTEARRLRSDILGIGGRYLIQVRAHDLALIALRGSLEDAVEIGDIPLAASAISTQAWAMMRQGRLTEVEELCLRTADQIEPKMSAATPEQLGAWGWLLIRAAGAASRNNRPNEAREYASLAHTAGTRLGRQDSHQPGYRTFGPADTMIAAVETEMTGHQPGKALGLAKEAPRRVGKVNSSTLHRHRLTLADARLQTGEPDKAEAILTRLRREHPEWLRYQQYGRDVVRKLLSTRARTLTGEQRQLAEFLNVEG